MRSILPTRRFLPEEANVRLVDERGGLEGVAGPLLAHIPLGEAPEFAVHQLQQLGLGCVVSRRDCVQKTGNLSG
jgi:hypothetical protein